jgi:hypothetical protein
MNIQISSLRTAFYSRLISKLFSSMRQGEQSAKPENRQIFWRSQTRTNCNTPLSGGNISASFLNAFDTDPCKTRYIDSGGSIVHEYVEKLGQMMSRIEELHDEVVSGRDVPVLALLPLNRCTMPQTPRRGGPRRSESSRPAIGRHRMHQFFPMQSNY